VSVAWIAKVFDLVFPDDQPLLVYDTTKITNRNGDLRLKGTGVFPTTTDLLARLPLVDCPDLVAWDSIDADVTEPEDEDEVVVGTVRFRLNDGTTDRYWTGATWGAAGAGNWNTLAQVQANLASFPKTSKKIRIVVELKTTDSRFTPILHRARLLVKTRQESAVEEVLFRAFVAGLRAEVRPTADLRVPWPGGLSANLTALGFTAGTGFFTEATGLKVVGMDSVLDSVEADLLSSFVLGTGVVTLSSDPGAVELTLRAIFEPVVAVSTHSDWNELPRLPAIVVEPRPEESMRAGGADRVFFHNRNDDTAKSLVAPRTTNLPLTLRCLSSRVLDVLRTSDAVQTWLQTRPTLRVAALDEAVDLVLETPSDVRPSEQGNAHEARIGVKIRNVRRFDRVPKAEYVVQIVDVSVTKA